jgi:hypothetical protein
VCAGLEFDLNPDSAFQVLVEWNRGCQPPWSENELRHKIDDAGKQPGTRGFLLDSGRQYDGPDPDLRHLIESIEGQSGSNVPATGLSLLELPPDIENDWPAPLEAPALYGLAGEFVADTLPETEADGTALLLQFLTYAAAVIGRNRYFLIGGTSHHARLYSVAVGGTSTGRKGTAFDCVHRVFEQVDCGDPFPFCKNNIESGLTSGAGLIWRIRDPGRSGKDGDCGVEDKRLLVVEPELGRVLRVCQRKENDLSAVMRDAWDGKHLRTLGKKEPARVTDPHVNIIGHVTREELRATICKVDMANGFANRFLWYCVRRSKLLPDGGRLDSAVVNSLAGRLRAVVEFTSEPGEMSRSDSTQQLWHAEYPRLTADRPGVFGKVTTRAEAQALRLSMLYALLDQSNVIELPHLEAALAVVKYCEASARWAFGASLGDKTADELLAALRHVKPAGLSATDIQTMFQRNRDASQIRQAFGVLQRNNLARFEKLKQSGPGRPTTIWFAT